MGDEAEKHTLCACVGYDYTRLAAVAAAVAVGCGSSARVANVNNFAWPRAHRRHSCDRPGNRPPPPPSLRLPRTQPKANAAREEIKAAMQNNALSPALAGTLTSFVVPARAL